MPKFNVGDLVRGTGSGSYTYTTEDSVCEISEIIDKDGRDKNIRVKVVKQPHYPHIVGKCYNVNSRDFELVLSASPSMLLIL